MNWYGLIGSTLALGILVVSPTVETASARDGGGDRPVTPRKPNAIERAIECDFNSANAIAEAKETLNIAKLNIESNKFNINNNIEAIANTEEKLEKERRSDKPDKQKIKDMKRHIKFFKRDNRRSKRIIKESEKNISKYSDALDGC